MNSTADAAARDLRNGVSAVLRRVEAGERLRITVSGRPVAELVPLSRRPQWVGWDELMRDADAWQADAGLADELRELLPETTDDPPPP